MRQRTGLCSAQPHRYTKTYMYEDDTGRQVKRYREKC